MARFAGSASITAVDTAATSGQGRVDRGRSVWLLPEDGIVDEIAVEIAASGLRRVALTPKERLLAAVRILTFGGTQQDIADRLHLSGSTTATLTARARRHISADPADARTASHAQPSGSSRAA